ncbi:cytochrome [Bordetella genomosp. 13]|uniref:Cytochrome n=2 Tax=Bordetella genomosp. 13 TaxID=463040 RepID=A0A1W6ZCB2_9BORD|nr:cytochrome [Bordetella genomosp. 13]
MPGRRDLGAKDEAGGAERSSALAAGSSDLAPPGGARLLHGMVLRPAQPRWNGRHYTGPRLRGADRSGLQGMAGLAAVVVEGDFVGVVAGTLELARQAAARLVLDWDDAAGSEASTTAWQQQDGPDQGRPGQDGRKQDSSRQDDPQQRDIAQGAPSLDATYRWPAHSTASASASAASPANGAAWAIASWRTDELTVWAGAPAAMLQAELAQLLQLPPERVRVLPTGQAPHPGAVDAAADAALLSRAVGRAVRVSAPPARPHIASHTLHATLDAHGDIVAQCWQDDGSGIARPSMARLLVGQSVTPATRAMHLRPPYAYADASVVMAASTPLDAAPASWPATQAARVFAQESFMDEAAARAGSDPVAYRLRHLDDARGAALVERVARQAGWQAGDGTPSQGKTGSMNGSTTGSMIGETRTGRGFAYACVLDDAAQPPRRVWSAWVADVAVDPDSGQVALTRVVVGHDADEASTDAGSPDAAFATGRIRDAARRLLPTPSAFDDSPADAAREPGPGTRDLAIDLLAAPRELARADDKVPAPTDVAWSDAAALPAAAAVANAIFHATGVRLREPPFDGVTTRHALAQAAAGKGARARRSAYAWLGGIAAAAAGLIVSALPWRGVIAPVAPPDLSLYSAAALERGRLVAAAGDCVVCHTAPGGAPNAGGLALDTPFGAIYTTNITPDVETGIGNWSYAAFERAMRQGVHRDGRQLYPAFPYTSFAKLTDADMQALYAYLMSQPAVRHTPPETRLAFPYNLRPLMAGWNLLFHDDKVYRPDPTQSLAWNRGAYLVQGAGHCGACHTPRNPLGAERRGIASLLAGGEAEGWEAPALNALSRAPIAWSEDDLYAYLRTGFSERHGVAAGPMAPVIHGLSALPDEDVRAMAIYLASLNPVSQDGTAQAAAVRALEADAAPDARLFPENGERIFQGACAACHETREAAPLFGARPSLALNTSLHSDRPDNLIQVILHGIAEPASASLGYMPAFGGSLNDAQVAELVEYMRARFAPQRPGWDDVARRVGELRGGAAEERSASPPEAALRQPAGVN